MRLHRHGMYWTLGLLTVSGLTWIVINGITTDVPATTMDQQLWKLWLMRIHAFAGSLSLLFIGATWAVHSAHGWRAKKSRVSGAANLTAWLVLALTAYLLGYASDGMARQFAAWLHWGVGIALPLIVWLHMAKSSPWRFGKQPR